MAEFFDITDWQEKIHYQTGGTRSKAVVENPKDNVLYFFKKSIPKYKHEFWSEIIASEVGTELGFNLPKNLIEHKLPDNRKELIINLITLRIERLKELQL